MHPDVPAPGEDQADRDSLATVLDSLDALVYVADMHSHDMLFINAYGRRLWGEPGGRKCWQILQSGQDGPCSFCTNRHLLDDSGRPTGVYVWEFRNTVTGHWFQCRDQAIRWVDGRLVRLEVATDITERKHMEEALRAARQRAEELAFIDELTGLHNRRAFFNTGDQLLRHATRDELPLALIMFDLDHFKQINDRHGHAQGDHVLQAVADILRRLLRDADLCARLGGEEFAVLLMHAGRKEALLLAERLRTAIAALSQPLPDSNGGGSGHALRCSASFGVVTCQGGRQALDLLLSKADHAMYAAKQAGRNRIYLAGEGAVESGNG